MVQAEAVLRNDMVAREQAKAAMVRIKNFVVYGEALDDLTTALVQGDEDGAKIKASSALLGEGGVPDLIDWVNQHIPSGRFSTADDIASWRSHEGLSRATDDQRMWFFMLSNYWSPRRLGDKLKPNAIQA